MIITLWFLVGLVGAVWVFYANVLMDHVQLGRSIKRCPTPRGVLGLLLLSLAGPFVLMMGFMMTLGVIASWFVLGPKKKTWWTTPLCGDED